MNKESLLNLAVGTVVLASVVAFTWLALKPPVVTEVQIVVPLIAPVPVPLIPIP
jgi:hypothetical protein